MAKFEQQIDINAPINTVWAILANPTRWPQWFPDIEGVTNLSALQTGGTFQWQHNGDTGSGTIIRIEPGHLLIVTTQKGDHESMHTFQLDKHGGLLGGPGGSRVEYKLEYHAAFGFIGEFLAGGNPADLLKVKNTLKKIKELAEGEATHG